MLFDRHCQRTEKCRVTQGDILAESHGTFVGINVCSRKDGIISGYEIITIILLFKQTEFRQRKGIPMMKQVFCERCHLAAKLAAYEPGALVPGKNLRWAQKWSFTQASRSMTEHCCIMRGDDWVVFVLNYWNEGVYARCANLFCKYRNFRSLNWITARVINTLINLLEIIEGFRIHVFSQHEH